MQVIVTQDDIDNGVRATASQCAFAKAVSRTIPNKKVFVGHTRAYVGEGNAQRVFQMPDEAKLFIDYFDWGVKVQPAIFELKEITGL